MDLCRICVLASLALSLSCGIAHAAEGIDSVKDTDLPLNAGGNRVAILSASTRNMELDRGIKVGPVGNNGSTNCSEQEEGVMRYNSDSHEMQYCNGEAWKASFGSSKTCPATYLHNLFPNWDWARLRGDANLPEGKEGQLFYTYITGDYGQGGTTYSFQCVDGSWVYNGVPSR